MAEGWEPKNFFGTIGVKSLTVPANTETVITNDITIPQNGMYLVTFNLGGVAAEINRSIKIIRRDDNYPIIATYSGQFSFVSRLVDLYSGNQLYVSITTSRSTTLYTDSRYNSLSVIQIA